MADYSDSLWVSLTVLKFNIPGSVKMAIRDGSVWLRYIALILGLHACNVGICRIMVNYSH